MPNEYANEYAEKAAAAERSADAMLAAGEADVVLMLDITRLDRVLFHLREAARLEGTMCNGWALDLHIEAIKALQEKKRAEREQLDPLLAKE